MFQLKVSKEIKSQNQERDGYGKDEQV